MNTKQNLVGENLGCARFDQRFHLGDRLDPCVERVGHARDLVAVENARLDPRHVDDAGHLVDGTADESLRQSLHDENLNFLQRQARLVGDFGEGDRAVVGGALERHLHQAEQRNLLPQLHLLRLQVVDGAPRRLHLIELPDVARVEGVQQLDEPLVLGPAQRLDDGMRQQFPDVINAFPEQGGEAEEESLVGPLALGERLDGAAKELERATVVVGVLPDQPVVSGSEHVIFAVDGRDISGLLQDVLQVLDDLLRGFLVVQELKVNLALHHFAHPNRLVAHLHFILKLLDERDRFLLVLHVPDDHCEDLHEAERVDFRLEGADEAGVELHEDLLVLDLRVLHKCVQFDRELVPESKIVTQEKVTALQELRLLKIVANCRKTMNSLLVVQIFHIFPFFG